jgi:nucleotide-binding universal stress UspA family protein
MLAPQKNERLLMKTTTSKRRTTRTARARAAVRASTARSKPGEIIELVPSLLNIKSILVPIDFSATSLKALSYAVRFAEQFGGKITLLSVVEPVATPDFGAFPLMMEPEKAKQATKNQLDSVVRKAGIPERLLEKSLVRYGSPFVEITEVARTLKVDLIILTTHGYTGFKHVLMGSTAERVVRHAPCPVLTVREKEHEFV